MSIYQISIMHVRVEASDVDRVISKVVSLLVAWLLASGEQLADQVSSGLVRACVSSLLKDL